MKQITLDYLTNDLELLYSIMTEFSVRVFNYYNVDMTSGLTITRLALNIFMKNYYKIKEIALIDHIHIFNFIKQGYYGGITEVYKPHGFNLKYIDINSLYPFVALQPMPGLKATFIESYNNEDLKLEDKTIHPTGC